MAAKSGQIAALFINSGTSTLATDEAMLQVGSTAEFYITDRTKSWWDPAPANAPIFKIGSTVTVPTDIDYAAGYVTFAAYTTGAVTCTVYYFTPQALGGVYGFEANAKADTKDVTCMATSLNDPVIWKSYIKTMLDWTGKASRHFFYGRAWKLVNCTASNSDITWTLKEWGVPGNLRKVEYVTGTPLQVAYNAGTKTFTVTHTGTTTAAAVKAHADADPVIAALVELDVEGTGAGYVEDKTAAYFSGGRDASTDFNNIGSNILVRFYLDTTTGSLQIISGVCTLTGVPMDVKLDAIQESDLSFQGIGRLKYHTN